MGKFSGVFDFFKSTGIKNLVDEHAGDILDTYKQVSKELPKYEKGVFGATMAKASAGALMGFTGKSLYNEANNETGGVGSATFWGAVSGMAMIRPSTTSKFLKTWGRRSRVAGTLQKHFGGSILNELASASKNSLFHVEDKNLTKAYYRIMGGMRGAAIGATAGGIYGASSDNDTVLSGAFKGAFFGGITGGLFAKTSPIIELSKETGRLSANGDRFLNVMRKSRRQLSTESRKRLSSMINKEYNKKWAVKARRSSSFKKHNFSSYTRPYPKSGPSNPLPKHLLGRY